MTYVEFAFSCERVVSGVVVHNIGVKCPLVPFIRRLFFIKKKLTFIVFLLVLTPLVMDNSLSQLGTTATPWTHLTGIFLRHNTFLTKKRCAKAASPQLRR